MLEDLIRRPGSREAIAASTSLSPEQLELVQTVFDGMQNVINRDEEIADLQDRIIANLEKTVQNQDELLDQRAEILIQHQVLFASELRFMLDHGISLEEIAEFRETTPEKLQDDLEMLNKYFDDGEDVPKSQSDEADDQKEEKAE